MDTTPGKNFNSSMKTKEALGYSSMEPLGEGEGQPYDSGHHKNQSILISTDAV